MGKDKDSVRVSFVGSSAYQVTGSMTLVQTKSMKFLIEAGLTQGGSKSQDWADNTRRLPFKPKEIDYIFLGHAHADHMLLIPRLYAMGCNAKIIAPSGTRALFEIMGLDSAYIISKDADSLSHATGKRYTPYCTSSDVHRAADMFEEYGFSDIVTLARDLKFRFVPSGHIINAAQIEIWVTAGGRTRKIGYTSDLGSSIQKRFANKFEPIKQCDLLIGESTYAREFRPASDKDRRSDLAKMKSVITEVCVERHNRVLIPVFSLDRAQNIVSFLYDLFGKDDKFHIPILIDSPLTIKIFDYMRTHASEADRERMEEMMAWDNLVFIEAPDVSKRWMASGKPCCIVSSAGMLTAGRSRRWAATLLPDANAHILFCGFSVESSLASQIKSGKASRTISIDGARIPNRCGITDLHSFSGHMGRADLIEYYSNMDTPRIAIIHGEANAKVGFAKDLQDEIGRKNRTGRVICVTRSTELLI